MKNIWTDYEIDLLTQYNQSPEDNQEHLNILLQRHTRESIDNKSRILRLTKNRKRKTNPEKKNNFRPTYDWSSSEIKLLKTYYAAPKTEKLTLDKLLKKRSLVAIRAMASALRVKGVNLS